MVPSILTGMIKGASNAPNGFSANAEINSLNPFVAVVRARIATAEELFLNCNNPLLRKLSSVGRAVGS